MSGRGHGERTAPEPLDHEAIAERLDRLVERLAEGLAPQDRADASRPCWVPPATIVRLVRPYLGWN